MGGGIGGSNMRVGSHREGSAKATVAGVRGERCIIARKCSAAFQKLDVDESKAELL